MTTTIKHKHNNEMPHKTMMGRSRHVKQYSSKIWPDLPIQAQRRPWWMTVFGSRRTPFRASSVTIRAMFRVSWHTGVISRGRIMMHARLQTVVRKQRNSRRCRYAAAPQRAPAQGHQVAWIYSWTHGEGPWPEKERATLKCARHGARPGNSGEPFYPGAGAQSPTRSLQLYEHP